MRDENVRACSHDAISPGRLLLMIGVWHCHTRSNGSVTWRQARRTDSASGARNSKTARRRSRAMNRPASCTRCAAKHGGQDCSSAMRSASAIGVSKLSSPTTSVRPLVVCAGHAPPSIASISFTMAQPAARIALRVADLWRYAARCAAKSQTSSAAPSIELDFLRRMKFRPRTYRPGTGTIPPSWRSSPLLSNAGTRSHP